MSDKKDNSDHALQVSTLSAARDYPFDLSPSEAERSALATTLNLSQLRKLRFAGVVKSAGKRDWVLEAVLGATVVQPCVQTLDPVVTRIDTDVSRRFMAHWDETPDPGSETEMPQDDTSEPLLAFIDPWRVMVEALALELPDYPRSPEAQAMAAVSVTEPGKTPLKDEDTKPFAGLAALRDQLGKDPDTH